INSWDEIINKVSSRLSKWKLKTLYIGGRLTLIKSVLSSMPLYHMSIYKVPIGVLNKLEALRRNFFNGADLKEKKLAMIGWNKVLASKTKGGLGISSFFAVNRALLVKWIWRFYSRDMSLWYQYIRAMYGERGSMDVSRPFSRKSTWTDIVSEIDELAAKDISVSAKINAASLLHSFRREPRSGVEDGQYRLLQDKIHEVTLLNCSDRQVWSLTSSGEFSVKSARVYIDDLLLPTASTVTRWVGFFR
nr:RNA-directed DNA polymerase, eukaryota [Tanacetum cinerariifolium]